MESAFILNTALNNLEIVDAINERLMKSKSLTSFLLACDLPGDASFRSVYGFIWILDGYLEELECLFSKLGD